VRMQWPSPVSRGPTIVITAEASHSSCGDCGAVLACAAAWAAPPGAREPLSRAAPRPSRARENEDAPLPAEAAVAARWAGRSSRRRSRRVAAPGTPSASSRRARRAAGATPEAEAACAADRARVHYGPRDRTRSEPIGLLSRIVAEYRRQVMSARTPRKKTGRAVQRSRWCRSPARSVTSSPSW
jgi:hypothetical protein